MISENIRIIEKSIAETEHTQDVHLIAVSKTKPVSAIREAYDYGIRDFGENRVQELLEKMPQLPDDIRWHLIGHLQTNKVRQIVGKTFLIHSIDTLKLAQVIDTESAKKGVVTEGLLEINVGAEESKFGFEPDIDKIPIEEISHLANLRIRGLMTVAPRTDDPEDVREVFRKLVSLSVAIKEKNLYNTPMDFLSMGMSGDYKIAIQEGANYIRIGTSIFGMR